MKEKLIERELQIIELLEKQIGDLEVDGGMGTVSGGKMISQNEEWIREYRERLAKSQERLKKFESL